MCTALVVGNMIGSGVFLLPASLAPFGWNATFGWLLTIAGTLSLSPLSSRELAGSALRTRAAHTPYVRAIGLLARHWDLRLLGLIGSPWWLEMLLLRQAV